MIGTDGHANGLAVMVDFADLNENATCKIWCSQSGSQLAEQLGS